MDLPLTIGEFIFSPYDYSEYIRRGAVDQLGLIVDNVGGITSGMKLGRMAECFSVESQPHNWGSTWDHAVHFHCELAMPSARWFEMARPQGTTDRPYFKDQIRIDKDGYVPAAVKPGLGYEVSYDVLDNLTKTIER